MSRKLDWADKEARILAIALRLNSDATTERALIAATLRLAYQRGVGDELDRLEARFKTPTAIEPTIDLFGKPRNKPEETP